MFQTCIVLPILLILFALHTGFAPEIQSEYEKMNRSISVEKKCLFMGVFLVFVGVCIYFVTKRTVSLQSRSSNPTILRLVKKLSPVFPELKKVQIYSDDSSYTINKKTIYLCVEGKDGTRYDDNMLTYVLLHELAHVINPTVGHDDSFDSQFKNLLDRAQSFRLYDPSIPRPSHYCNVKPSA